MSVNAPQPHIATFSSFIEEKVVTRRFGRLSSGGGQATSGGGSVEGLALLRLEESLRVSGA